MAHADIRIDGQRVLGTFSTDDERTYVNDDRNRRFYLNPGNEFDLDYGEGFQTYTDRSPSSNFIYEWMQDHRQVLTDSGILDTDRSRLNVDFVASRGLLTNILQLGGNKDLDIGVAVTLYRGTYHLRKARGVSPPRGRTGDNPNVDFRMRAASSKLLLQFLTSRDGRTPDEPAPLNENASFYAVMSVNCGRHRLLFRGEVQAEKRVNTDDPPPALPIPRNCLNVRTRNQHYIIPPMTALAWWAPNVISGIPKIVMGLRDDERKIIHKVEYLETDRLTTSRYAQNRRHNWEPGACIRTMESLLSQIKELVPEDDPDSFKYAFLVVRPVPDDQRVERGRRFEVWDRLEEDKVTEEQKIRNVLEGNE